MNIHIEYCVRWNYGPEFDRVSKIIKAIVSNCKISGNLNSPRTGSFEIEVDGKLVYSKFNTSRFPTEQDLKKIFQ